MRKTLDLIDDCFANHWPTRASSVCLAFASSGQKEGRRFESGSLVKLDGS